MMAKKSQAEAFGLVLIVALVFVVFVIMARIEQNRSPSDIKNTYEQNELSSSTINTMLSTVMRACNDRLFSDVLIECVKNQNSRCTNGYTTCDNFILGTRKILNTTFNRVKLDYYMTFDAEGRMLPEQLANKVPEDSSCSENLRGEDFVLPLNPGNVVITLVVCQK
jgi:hypothetical protein